MKCIFGLTLYKIGWLYRQECHNITLILTEAFQAFTSEIDAQSFQVLLRKSSFTRWLDMIPIYLRLFRDIVRDSSIPCSARVKLMSSRLRFSDSLHFFVTNHQWVLKLCKIFLLTKIIF